jgi:hypothetical protein
VCGIVSLLFGGVDQGRLDNPLNSTFSIAKAAFPDLGCDPLLLGRERRLGGTTSPLVFRSPGLGHCSNRLSPILAAASLCIHGCRSSRDTKFGAIMKGLPPPFRGNQPQFAQQAAARKRRRQSAATLVASAPAEGSVIVPQEQPPQSHVWPGAGGLPSTPLGAAVRENSQAQPSPPKAPDPPTHAVSVDAGMGMEFGATTKSEATAPAEAAPISIELSARSAGLSAGRGFLTPEPGDAEHAGAADAQLISQHCPHLLALAVSLEQLACAEIERIDNERPNDPAIIERNSRQREVLSILADGFAEIAAALRPLAKDINQPVLVGKAGEVVNAVAQRFKEWWGKNHELAIGWGARASFLLAGTAALGLTGVDVNFCAGLMGSIVGAKDLTAAAVKQFRKHN